MEVVADEKPHVVLIPIPLQSYTMAMLKSAKLLHFKGFLITFVTTEFNHKHFRESSGPSSLDGLPNFRFETITDGLPPQMQMPVNTLFLFVNLPERRCWLRSSTSSANSTTLVLPSVALSRTGSFQQLASPQENNLEFLLCCSIQSRHAALWASNNFLL